eukprot:5091209-Amphidinium_carterae.1
MVHKTAAGLECLFVFGVSVQKSSVFTVTKDFVLKGDMFKKKWVGYRGFVGLITGPKVTLLRVIFCRSMKMKILPNVPTHKGKPNLNTKLSDDDT